ncbi:hypothetical protein IWX49DRAFT_577150 [Phyllosticta citricarpa]
MSRVPAKVGTRTTRRLLHLLIIAWGVYAGRLAGRPAKQHMGEPPLLYRRGAWQQQHRRMMMLVVRGGAGQPSSQPASQPALFVRLGVLRGRVTRFCLFVITRGDEGSWTDG